MDRKDEILKILENSSKPIRGVDLGRKFDVTRQVIVKDIAILRAEGADIVATNRGYIIHKDSDRLIKKIACKHSTMKEMEDELNTVVDYGGRVLDIIIEHPIYGEITGKLELSNRFEVKEFVDSIEVSRADPLSKLTEGLHLHTIEVDSIEMLKNIEKALLEKSYLVRE